MEEEPVVLRKDALVLVRVYPEHRLISLQWMGYAPSAEFRSILELALLNVRCFGVRRWLADLRRMNAILRQDEQWSVADWFPRLADAGLERMAIVESADYFNQTSVERIVDAASPEMPFPVTYHATIEEAERWLLSDGSPAT